MYHDTDVCFPRHNPDVIAATLEGDLVIEPIL